METARSLLCQADALAGRSIIGNQPPEQRQALATAAVAYALIAIGQELAEMNARRPIIPIPVHDIRAPLPDDDSLGED